MQLRSIAMALVRLVLALSLVAVLAPLGSHEAVAGRFGSGDSEPAKDGDGEKASSATAAPAKGGANTYSAEELRARAEARARAEEEQANAPPAPRLRLSSRWSSRRRWCARMPRWPVALRGSCASSASLAAMAP